MTNPTLADDWKYEHDGSSITEDASPRTKNALLTEEEAWARMCSENLRKWMEDNPY